MKRALIITYYWPPAGGSGVQRWLKFTKYLREFGYEPIIYTPENPEYMAIDNSLEAEIPEGVEVIKRKIWEPYSLYKKFTGRKEGITPGFLNSSDSGEKISLKEKLSLFIRSNLFFPDPKMFWIGPSVRFLKKYLAKQENKVDVIITTGPPHSMHIIGRRVSKATSVPWIADFRDPWTKMYNFKYMGYTTLLKRKHEKAERKVLSSADGVVTVTETIRAELEEIVRKAVIRKTEKGDGENTIEQAGKRVFVITNGYDEADFATSAPPLDQNFTLTFTGLFVKSQNTNNLWKVLGEMISADTTFASDLRIKLIGHIDATILEDISAFGLRKNLILMGYTPHDQVIERQRSAQLLLLSVGSEPEAKGILTGKFFEYLAARRPILAFGIKGGDIDIVLEECCAGIMLPYDNESDLRERIESYYKKFKNSEISYTSGSIERYSRRVLTQKMAAVMDSCQIRK